MMRDPDQHELKLLRWTLAALAVVALADSAPHIERWAREQEGQMQLLFWSLPQQPEPPQPGFNQAHRLPQAHPLRPRLLGQCWLTWQVGGINEPSQLRREPCHSLAQLL